MPVGRGIAGDLAIQPGHMSDIITIGGVDPSLQLHLVYDTTNPGTAADTLEIPVQAGVQNYSIDWGDGHTINYTTGGVKSHVYADGGGIKTVKIFGTCFGLQYGVAFDTTNDRQKLVNLLNWGTDLTWVTLNGAFTGCINVCIDAVDVPDWTNVTDASFAFASCANVTIIASNLPTGNIVTFTSTFESIGVTTFPVLDFSSATSMISTWEACLNLTTFPSQTYSLVTTFQLTWFGCIALTSWGAPLATPTLLLTLVNAYGNCALTSYPFWDTSAVLNVNATWSSNNFGTFPLLDLSNCVNFESTWSDCALLGFLGEVFPAIDFSGGLNLKDTWKDATNVELAFVPNFSSMTDGTDCFQNTSPFDCETYSLLLIDLDNNNPNNGVAFHAGNSSNTALSETAKDNLEARVPPWVVTDANSSCELLWLNDGSGGINNPWDNNEIWMN